MRFTVVALLALCMGCAGPEAAIETEVVLPATGVVARATHMSRPLNAEAGKTVFVVLTAGTKLRDVLDLRLFGSLAPGMTCEEAAGVLGVVGRYADSCVFDLPSARVHVAHESSSSFGETSHRRTLYAYPKP